MAATRWGIVSAGKISHDFVTSISALSKDEHNVVAVAARDGKRAEQFAKEFSIPKAYASYEDLANDPNVDIAYVGCVHDFHFEICLMLLNAGKHVLCEKPAMLSQRHMKEICTLAKERKLFFMEAMWSRFYPAYQRVQEIIKEGTIGDVYCVFAPFHLPVPVEQHDGNMAGAGTFNAIGCYPIQFACFLFNDKPEKTTSMATFHAPGVDLSCSSILQFSNNRVAICSVDARGDDAMAIIYGRKGQITMPDFYAPTSITTPEKTYDFPLPEVEGTYNYRNSQGLQYEAQAVRQSLLRGEIENELYPHSEMENVVTIMDEVRTKIGMQKH